MPQMTRTYWLHALSPLHAGVGFGLGFIDLPIMREKVSGWPIVPGSAVKGVLADYFKATVENRQRDGKLKAAFGTGGDEHSNSGSLVFTDARLVCLPVRSLYGTFAWVSSAMVLNRLWRDLEAANSVGNLPKPTDPPTKEVWVAEKSALVDAGKVYFQDLDFDGKDNGDAKEWAKVLSEVVFPNDTKWQDQFRSRFAIVPGSTFDFLSETGTEVTARVRMDPDRKTVAKGALWYEEYLPAETILGGLVWCDKVFGGTETQAELLSAYCKAGLTLQIGGKATIGKGRARCLFGGGNAGNA
jgi:CRISPR-associated protein Cmr4